MTKMLRKAVGLAVAAVMLMGTVTDVIAQGKIDRVGAHRVDTWTGYARAGELVRVVVNGDGDTDLDLYVYHGGELVASDDDLSDYCVAVFRARQSGTFQIRVVNRGSVWNEYELRIE